MRKRKLGQSELAVGELGLGTWGLSGEGYGPADERTVTATLDAAVETGTTFFETADSYADGKTLDALGALKHRHPNEPLVVSVRIGLDRNGVVAKKNFSPGFLRSACEATLRRLGTDTIDSLVLHNPLAVTLTLGEAWQALRDLQSEGKAKLIGVSISNEAQGRAAINLKPDLVVLPYNLLYPRLLNALSAELALSRTGVVVRSPLAYGLLADSWGATRRFADDDHRTFRWVSGDLTVRMKQREALRAMVQGDLHSIREAAIKYVLSNGLVSVVVPGSRTADHARQNAAAAESDPHLSHEDLTRLGTLLADIGVV